MADLYVYDTGSNTSPYDTVVKAATSLATAVSARGSGEKILMDYRHRESLSSTTTYTPGTSSTTDPCVLRSVDTADSDAYRLPTDHQIYLDGAAAGNDLKFAGAWLIEGCWFETNDDLNFLSSMVRSYQCSFKHKAGHNGTDQLTSNSESASIHIGSTFNFPKYRNDDRTIQRYYGCTFEASGDTPAINSGGLIGLQGGSIELIGCDLSAVGNSNPLIDVDDSTNSYGHLKLIQCDLPASYTMLSGTPNFGVRVEGYGCDDGEIHADFIYDLGGDVLQDSAVYADAGFNEVEDGRFAYAMTSNSGCKLGVDLTSLFFGSVYTGSTGSKTFTVGCVHDFTSLNQADVGLLLYYLGTSGSPAWDVAFGLDFGGATTALASHSADWTGAAGKTKVNLTATATVNQTGFYAAQVVLRKYESGKKFWFDPVLTVS